jgi:hypothetical protein
MDEGGGTLIFRRWPFFPPNSAAAETLLRPGSHYVILRTELNFQALNTSQAAKERTRRPTGTTPSTPSRNGRTADTVI